MTTRPTTDCTRCPARAHGLLGLLPDAALTALERGRHDLHYRRGQALGYEGAPTTGVFCPATGRIKLVKTAADGRQYILRIASPGDWVGLESLFCGGPSHATAEMLEDGWVCHLDREVLLALVQSQQKLASGVAEQLGKQLRAADSRCLELVQAPVRERLARLLAQLMQEHGVAEPGGTRIDLRLSREEIADMIGTAPETAIRALSALRREEIIHTRGRRIVVRHPARLRQAANLAA